MIYQQTSKLNQNSKKRRLLAILAFFCTFCTLLFPFVFDNTVQKNLEEFPEATWAESMADQFLSPLNFEKLHEILAKAETRKRYQKDWTAFVKFSCLTESYEAPTEDKFLNYLKHRREVGKLAGKSLQSLLSELSTMCLHFYGFKADEVSELKQKFQINSENKWLDL